MTDTERIEKLVRIGLELINIQLTLASKEPEDALNDIWALGYCFGLLDALGQRAKLDQYSEGIALITIVFSLLMASQLEGADKVSQSLDSQTNPAFLRGNQTGGSDLFAWSDHTNKVPLGLFNYLSEKS